MNKLTYITGNQNKADLIGKYTGFQVEHVKIDLDEIQSLDLREVVSHKARQAYEVVKSPVLVDDVSLGFQSLGSLPGPFIKWFVDRLGLEGLCRMLDNFEARSATAEIGFGYCEGGKPKLFMASMEGSIAMHPMGENGFGWDAIFISEGDRKTWAEYNIEEYPAYKLREIALHKLQLFLKEKNDV